MKPRIIIILALVIGLPLSSVGRADEIYVPRDKDTTPLHLPVKALHDLSNLFVHENLPIFLVGAGLAGADVLWWDSTNDLATNLDNLRVEPLFDFGNFYGEGWVEGGLALGSWSIGALAENTGMQEFGRDCTEAIIMGTIFAWGGKLTVNRIRPNGLPFSTPSGHTIMAFCVAPIIDKYGGIKLGIPAYVLASITGLARVEDYWHYFSDVVVGAAAGIIIGNAVVYTPKDVTLTVAPGQVGVRLAFD